MKLKILIAALLLSVGVNAAEIIPRPNLYTRAEGQFTISSRTLLEYDNSSSLDCAARYLCQYLPLSSWHIFPAGKIRLRVSKSLSYEAYFIKVSPDEIEITGGGYGGVFNGIQTLLQLLPPEVYSKECKKPLTIDCCYIEDCPKFEYRGFLLDVARTWIPTDKVKREIDLLAYHKINKLHFHLTDDEGWRIEIKSHPEFAKIGGFRGGDSPVFARYAKFDEKWGGYYTQEELRDIVEYARIRNIEVIPEVDMPGHSKALGAIHHDILCSYTPDTTISNGLDIRNVWCVAKESNYAIIEDIVRELATIFTSKYIHIGGDEVDFLQWRKCPDCQRLKAEKGLANEKQLEDYFIARCTEILAKYDRLPAAWNEAINGGTLPTDTRIHGWQGIKHCKESTTKGYPTIIMPGQYFYFDMKQSDGEWGHNWAAIFDASKVLSFDFDSLGFTEEQRQHVVGIEASFFSEIYVAHSPERSDYLDYMLYPRICALSEVAWCNERRSWEEFYTSLLTCHYDRMQAMGVAFRLSTPKVEYSNGLLSANVDDKSVIFYTDEKTGRVERYTAPIPTTSPWRYTFHSRYGSATSRTIGSKEYYATRKPAVTVTTSMPCRKNNPITNAAAYDHRIARTTRAANTGDYVLYTFDAPISCREIRAATGHLHLARCLLLKGHIEISENGTTFHRVAELKEGAATIYPKQPIRALRIVADGPSDAEDNVIFQSLQIK